MKQSIRSTIMVTSIRISRPQARCPTHGSQAGPLNPRLLHPQIQPTTNQNHSGKQCVPNMYRFLFCHYSLNNTGYNYLQGISVVSGAISDQRMHISYMAITWCIILYERPEYLQMWASWAEGGVLDPIPTGTKQWLRISIPGRYSCTVLPKIYQTSPKSSL